MTGYAAINMGMRTGSLRLFLQQLAGDGVIRIEVTQIGRLRRHAYFAAEHGDAHADRPLVPAGATA